MERKLVLRIYICLIGLIIIDPLFKNFISNTTILRLIELVLFILVILTEVKLYQRKMLVFPHGLSLILYIALSVIMLGIILRGEWNLPLNEFMLKIIGETKGWLLPILLIPLPNEKYFVDIVKVFFKASMFIIPLWLLNFSDLVQVGTYKGESIGAYLGFFSAFLLGLLPFFKKGQKKWILLVWGVYFLLMLLNARRNASLTLALYALIAYVFSILHNIKRNPIKYYLICLFSVVVFLLVYLNLSKLAAGPFNNLAQRGLEDTRSQVEELFFIDFANSPATDWAFGRGMDGGYYQVTKNQETGELSDNRKGLETGYLTMMLKGGLVYDIVVVWLMIIAVTGAFINKNSIVVKFLAVILATYFLDMYTTNPVVDYGARSIIFWFIISVLIQNKIKLRRYVNTNNIRS